MNGDFWGFLVGCLPGLVIFELDRFQNLDFGHR